MRVSLLFVVHLIVCVLLCQRFSVVDAQTAADLPFLREQSIRAILSSVGSAYQIKLIQTNLQSDGSFSDINYGSQDRVAWPAADHWQRLMYMAEAYSLNTSTWYQNSGMKANFSKAFDYWFSGSFNNINPNWWFNQIGVPTNAGPACLLMRDQVTATQRQNCLVIGARANWTDWTGQNVMWQAEARLFFALMVDDFPLVMACVEAIKSVLVITPGLEEGIKVDGAFLQHGPQIYNGGYGTALTSDILSNVIPTLSGTAFDLSGSSIDAFAKVFLDGHQWMINTFGDKNTWHTIPLGRQISRYNGVTASMPPVNYVRLVTGSRSSEWVAFADRFQRVNNPAPLVGNKAYWTADYLIHNRANYSIGLRMYSKRTYNAECVNEEGKKSMKLADGSMFIYTGGLEYTNIYGAFDWEKIPGITSEVNSIPFICNATTNNIQVRNSKITFAGTVSNGQYGLSGYSYLPPPSLTSTLKFKKSWFYFDNEIVVLASGISTNSSYDVLTTLDQRRVNGPIYTSGSSTPLVKGLHDFTSDWWVHHDSVGYVLPEVKNGRKDLTLHVENVNKTGSWSAINIDGTANDNVELFTAWIKGQSPKAQNDYHQLIVLPGVSYSDFPARRDSALNNIQVLSNTPQLQAVYHSSLKILSSTFFVAGNVSANDWTVTVDAPCLVMLYDGSSGLSLSVADPTQNLTSVTIHIASNQALQCDSCTANGSTTSLTVILPSGDYIGSSAVVNLQSVGSPSSNNGGQPTTGSVPGHVSSAESYTSLINLVVLIVISLFI